MTSTALWPIPIGLSTYTLGDQGAAVAVDEQLAERGHGVANVEKDVEALVADGQQIEDAEANYHAGRDEVGQGDVRIALPEESRQLKDLIVALDQFDQARLENGATVAAYLWLI